MVAMVGGEARGARERDVPAIQSFCLAVSLAPA